ncbi:MAG TPA: Rieske 2Fe-2S domain-containing protein, partial [Halobacteriales archaeon]|nr:Rieske 2Fe-2S domain-containing protein [Halobacteriales archaeon]
MASSLDDDFERVASLSELRGAGRLRVTADGRAIGLFHHEGEVYAVDDRCPHMGFPLTRGTVEDGVLTCHWHHARFELSCGDTFDPFADDVPTYPVEVRGDDVWVDVDPEPTEPPEEHWSRRLEDGLEEDLSLVIAKSVIGLDDADVPPDEPLRIGVEFGTSYREDGWASGLTTLAAMANLGDFVDREDRRRALYVGLSAVADDCAGEPPFFAQDAFRADDLSAARLENWFRENVEVRDADGAERVLRTAIREELPPSAVVSMLVGAATDHRYLDSGHQIDFVNKAVETVER